LLALKPIFDEMGDYAFVVGIQVRVPYLGLYLGPI
jgi:hypothetical protein